MKGAVTAPSAPASPRIRFFWSSLNPRPPWAGALIRYDGSRSSHRPHTAYWRNIMTASSSEFLEKTLADSVGRAS